MLGSPLQQVPPLSTVPPDSLVPAEHSTRRITDLNREG